MSLELSDHDGYAEVTAKGRLNMVAAPDLKAAVNNAIAAGHRRLVLNLAETDFMDSSGLGAIVVCLRAARQAGGDLRLANVGEQVGMVLELTGMDRVLTPYASSEEAYRNG